MYNQIKWYMENHLSPYLFGFRKAHSPEQCLNTMLENWKQSLDYNKQVGAVISDLLKAFDCLNHDLLIAKCEAYGFNTKALTFIQDYLFNRLQRTKINSEYSWFGIKESGLTFQCINNR